MSQKAHRARGPETEKLNYFFLRLYLYSEIHFSDTVKAADRPSSSRSRSWQRKPYKGAPIVRRHRIRPCMLPVPLLDGTASYVTE